MVYFIDENNPSGSRSFELATELFFITHRCLQLGKHAIFVLDRFKLLWKGLRLCRKELFIPALRTSDQPTVEMHTPFGHRSPCHIEYRYGNLLVDVCFLKYCGGIVPFTVPEHTYTS